MEESSGPHRNALSGFWRKWLPAIVVLVAELAAIAPAGAIYGGRDDDDTPEANVVVSLGLGPANCTGTLITPRIVLTAAHCVTSCGGTVNPQVYVGEYAGTAALPENTRHTESVESRVAGCFDFGKEIGIDMALLFLDAPVLDQARIVRPSLTSPYAGGSDDNGGDYGFIGIAGWSPYGPDGQTGVPHQILYRQAVRWNTVTLHHYPGLPDDPAGQFWVHVVDGIGLGRGDSGGPLFVVRPDGTRDPIGVVSGISWNLYDCGFYSCDYWADITRGYNAQWIRDHVKDSDHGGHSTAWRYRHGKPDDFWFGEVDYTGHCQQVNDADCDHWYDAHDNCPSTPNVDQGDSDDDGIGDACPPPPPAPWCTAQWECDDDYHGATVISCPLGLSDLTLQRLIDGTFETISANTTQDLNAFVDYDDPPAGTVVTYQVIRSDLNGSTPSGPLTVMATDCSCHPDTSCGGDAECGTLPDGCGGTVSCGTCGSGLSCSENHCCPTGQSWDGIRNLCTTRPRSCPLGQGDCGGYCCRCTANRCS
jgi:Trypsin